MTNTVLVWAVWFVIAAASATALRATVAGEGGWFGFGVAAVGLGAAALRVVAISNWPAGWSQDEPHFLWDGMLALDGDWHTLIGFCGGPPTLGQAMQAVFVPLIGAQAAARLPARIGGVIAAVGTCGVARRLSVGRIPALAAGALTAVLPWSLLYGRTAQGGELLAAEMFALLGGAAFVRQHRVGITDVALLWVGIVALLYSYYAGRVILPITVAWCVATQSWPRRAAIAAIVTAATAAYALTILGAGNGTGVQFQWVGIIPGYIPTRYPIGNLAIAWPEALYWALASWWSPVARATWMSVPAGATVPVWLLTLAAIGVMKARWRVAIFVAAVPTAAILAAASGAVNEAWDVHASTHRMLLGYVAVPLGTALAVDCVRTPWVRAVVAVAVVCVAGWWSISTYFSPVFWEPKATAIYGAPFQWGELHETGMTEG